MTGLLLGCGFGRTPFGRQQVLANVCTCDPELVELDIADIQCPRHGLVAFARSIGESAE